MVELPPLNDDDDDLVPLVSVAKYNVPFKLKEEMLCYGRMCNTKGQQDLIGWLNEVEWHYFETFKDFVLPFRLYSVLFNALKVEFPGLDFDVLSAYCDDERTCPRPRLIRAWRAFLSNMQWGECDEPEPDVTSRKQKRKK